MASTHTLHVHGEEHRIIFLFFLLIVNEEKPQQHNREWVLFVFKSKEGKKTREKTQQQLLKKSS